MIVVDSNVIADLLLPSARSNAARAALARDDGWAAPYLWRSEIRNLLAVRVRRRNISPEDAHSTQRWAEALLAGHEFLVDSPRVLALALGSGCTAYDCEFVALAEALETLLVTSDHQILASFPRIAVGLEVFAAT